MKRVDSQQTDAMGELQADLALALPSHASDHESLLSDSINVLKGASERLFDCGQDEIAADKKVVGGACHSPVNVADRINGTGPLLRDRSTGVDVRADVSIANVNRHSFIYSFRVLSHFLLPPNKLTGQSLEAIVFNRGELDHVTVVGVNRHDWIVCKRGRDFRDHFSHHRQWQLFEKARHLDTTLVIIAKIAYHREKGYLEGFKKLIFCLQYRKQ